MNLRHASGGQQSVLDGSIFVLPPAIADDCAPQSDAGLPLWRDLFGSARCLLARLITMSARPRPLDS